MPAVYISRHTGYVDDPDAVSREQERYRLDEMGDPHTVIDIIETIVERHISAAAGELDPLDRALSRAATLASALIAYRRISEGYDGPRWRDGITDAYAYRSEVTIWDEPTLAELEEACE